MAKIKFKLSPMCRQRLLGISIIGLCVIITVIACFSTVPEDRDLTPVVCLLPLGVYILFTKEYVLSREYEEVTLNNNDCKEGEAHYGKETDEGRAGA